MGTTLHRTLPFTILLAACSSTAPEENFETWLVADHEGPPVSFEQGGPRRFVQPLARFVQPGEAPGPWNVTGLEERLRRAGFGKELPYELAVREGDHPAVVATLVGLERRDELVVLAAEPVDHAAASAAALDSLVWAMAAFHDAHRASRVTRPRRSLSVVFGLEQGAAQAYLSETTRLPIAAIVTGPVAGGGTLGFHVRIPTSTAAETLPPEVHAASGGVAIITRTAAVDSSRLSPSWSSAEGLSAPTPRQASWLARGLPSVELSRPGEAGAKAADTEHKVLFGIGALTAALAVADAKPEDLDRYLETWSLERNERLGELEEGDPLIPLLRERSDAVRHWLRRLCMGLPLDGSGG